jgi:flagellar basal body-associated protein FliL
MPHNGVAKVKSPVKAPLEEESLGSNNTTLIIIIVIMSLFLVALIALSAVLYIKNRAATKRLAIKN